MRIFVNVLIVIRMEIRNLIAYHHLQHQLLADEFGPHTFLYRFVLVDSKRDGIRPFQSHGCVGQNHVMLIYYAHTGNGEVCSRTRRSVELIICCVIDDRIALYERARILLNFSFAISI